MVNDSKKAELLEQSAQDLEDAIARDYDYLNASFSLLHSGAALDISRDDLAVITISQVCAHLKKHVLIMLTIVLQNARLLC